MATLDRTLRKNPFKRTDYRHELWNKERKLIKEKAKKSSFSVTEGLKPDKRKGIITVDTSKSRSNLDVLRICLKELAWREVFMHWMLSSLAYKMLCCYVGEIRALVRNTCK